MAARAERESDLPGGLVSGHIRFLQDQLQPDQPKHRAPYQGRKGGSFETQDTTTPSTRLQSGTTVNWQPCPPFPPPIPASGNSKRFGLFISNDTHDTPRR